MPTGLSLLLIWCFCFRAVRGRAVTLEDGFCDSVTWARDIRGLCRHKLIAVGRGQDVTLSRSFAASNRRVVTRLFSITSGARFE